MCVLVGRPSRRGSPDKELDGLSLTDIYLYPMRTYSTTQVAKMLGILQPNLQRLIARKRIPFPPLTRVGRLKIRLWSARDVERARKAIAKAALRRQV